MVGYMVGYMVSNAANLCECLTVWYNTVVIFTICMMLVAKRC